VSHVKINRRNFIKATAAGIGAVMLPSGKAWGANDRINVAVIGCGNRGRSHVRWVESSGGSVLAVCDPDLHHMEAAAKIATETDKVRRYQDIRKLMDDKDIDAVVIATPNHWHALATIMACQAGKDVYVEKPASHSIWEGRKMVQAAQHYNRIVQLGTQQRSDPALIELKKSIANKELGEVEWIHSIWYAKRQPIGKVSGPQTIPNYIDYNLWCGPRKKVPLMRKRFHYDWHWFWDYGNGDMGNRVIHTIDDIHHVMQMEDNIPHKMMAVGGRFKYKDDAQTPNTEIILMDWKVPIIFGSRDLPFIYKETGKTGGPSVYNRFGKHFRFTNLIKCEQGFFAVTRNGGVVYDNTGKRIRKINGDGGKTHMRNFLDAVRSRKTEDLRAPIASGHMANLMLLTGNISYRCGKPTTTADVAKSMQFCEESSESWKQTVAHLADNGVDLNLEKPIIGPWLNFDAKHERFTGNTADMANSFLRETMRPEFSIPDNI